MTDIYAEWSYRSYVSTNLIKKVCFMLCWTQDHIPSIFWCSPLPQKEQTVRIAVSRVTDLPKQHTELLVIPPTAGFKLNKNTLSFFNLKTHSDWGLFRFLLNQKECQTMMEILQREKRQARNLLFFSTVVFTTSPSGDKNSISLAFLPVGSYTLSWLSLENICIVATVALRKTFINISPFFQYLWMILWSQRNVALSWSLMFR